MCAVAADAESIEHRNSHRREKVSVRRTTDLRFTELEIDFSRNRARLFVKFYNCGRAFHRWTIDTAGNEDFRALIDGFEIRKDTFDLVPPWTTPTFSVIPEPERLSE